MLSGICLHTFNAGEPVLTAHLCGEKVTLHTKSKIQIIRIDNNITQKRTIDSRIFDRTEAMIDSIHSSPFGDSFYSITSTGNIN